MRTNEYSHPNTITIEGDKVTIDKVKNLGHGWSAIYVDGFASCHKVPTDWLVGKSGRYKVFTNGKLYEKNTRD